MRAVRLANPKSITISAHDATLQSLKLSSGSLSPTFDPRTLEYKATAAAGVKSVTVTALPKDHGALLAVNNVACPAGAPSSPVELAPHKPTAVAIVVTASDTKSTSTYTVMVSMPSAPEVKPQLKALTISKGTLVVSVSDRF